MQLRRTERRVRGSDRPRTIILPPSSMSTVWREVPCSDKPHFLSFLRSSLVAASKVFNLREHPFDHPRTQCADIPPGIGGVALQVYSAAVLLHPAHTNNAMHRNLPPKSLIR